jgi:hypothetical protein
MASYRGHLGFSVPLGVAYGGLGYLQMGLDWGPAIMGGGLTAVGGLLPDLDSDSGVPVRELFGLAACLAPILLLPRLTTHGFSPEQILVLLAGIYVLIRYGLQRMFKSVTVHRGMFHSIPAMLIAGLAVFDLYEHRQMLFRIYLAAGVMLGFLSHLVLDEMCSVNLVGAKVKLNQFAGSAVKFFSKSYPANLATYALLIGLACVASYDFEGPRQKWQNLQARTLRILAPEAGRK